MRTSAQVIRWDSGLALSLPTEVAAAAQIAEGDMVELFVEEGTITIKRVRPTYSLDDLLSKITPENRHAEQW